MERNWGNYWFTSQLLAGPGSQWNAERVATQEVAPKHEQHKATKTQLNPEESPLLLLFHLHCSTAQMGTSEPSRKLPLGKKDWKMLCSRNNDGSNTPREAAGAAAQVQRRGGIAPISPHPPPVSAVHPSALDGNGISPAGRIPHTALSVGLGCFWHSDIQQLRPHCAKYIKIHEEKGVFSSQPHVLRSCEHQDGGSSWLLQVLCLLCKATALARSGFAQGLLWRGIFQKRTRSLPTADDAGPHWLFF